MVHCWKGKRDWLEENGQLGSDEWLETYECDSSCMLESGHEGPHEFVRDDDIGITFPAVPTEHDSTFRATRDE